jgi:NADPH2:quinone reductase
MKAAIIYEEGGPEVLYYEDVPHPECPDGWGVIDVEAISTEGGNTLHRAGSPPPPVRLVRGDGRLRAGPRTSPNRPACSRR